MDILMRDTDFMSLFIDMLRELPCLWEITHPHFKNQAKRKAALEQLCEIVKQVIPTADITYLKILIGCLRSTYLRERKKVLDSQRSGAADDIYVPRMLYYDRLHFLAGQTEPRPSLSSLPSTLLSPPAEASDAQPGPSRPHVEEPRLSQGSLSQEVADLQVPPPTLKTESGSRRSSLEEAAIRFFWRATEVLGAPHTRQENLAAFIAYKMQRMEEGQQARCQALISEALEKGVRGQLTPHTQLWDGPPPPPPSPPGPPSPPPGPPSPPPGPPSPPPPPGPTPPPATSPTAQPQPGRKCERKTRE
ncbi:hypothetical protein AB205_0073580 [Aquarana catesbeiana]|uniref:MADF domain-containing protein n=1 Tax=Aquarana catesbeiana TaxID=8400 RepID=A0A2G9QFW7_AQUCT|nr:hypothetical protein AB205_0073580 [Aquarana catesbeiana]